MLYDLLNWIVRLSTVGKDLCRSVRISLEPFAKSTFFGLWKHLTNPACTKSVRVFVMLKLNTIRKKKKMMKPLFPARMDDRVGGGGGGGRREGGGGRCGD